MLAGVESNAWFWVVQWTWMWEVWLEYWRVCHKHGDEIADMTIKLLVHLFQSARSEFQCLIESASHMQEVWKIHQLVLVTGWLIVRLVLWRPGCKMPWLVLLRFWFSVSWTWSPVLLSRWTVSLSWSASSTVLRLLSSSVWICDRTLSIEKGAQFTTFFYFSRDFKRMSCSVMLWPQMRMSSLIFLAPGQSVRTCSTCFYYCCCVALAGGNLLWDQFWWKT